MCQIFQARIDHRHHRLHIIITDLGLFSSHFSYASRPLLLLSARPLSLSLSLALFTSRTLFYPAIESLTRCQHRRLMRQRFNPTIWGNLLALFFNAKSFSLFSLLQEKKKGKKKKKTPRKRTERHCEREDCETERLRLDY